MTKREEAEKLAIKLMAEHGISDWKFQWQTKKNALGTCKYYQKKIYLSGWYVDLNSWEFIKDTILHEIAHALSHIRHGEYGHGHGRLWKAICRELGCVPKASSKEAVSAEDHYKHVDSCECGKTYKKHRLRKANKYCCPKCRQPLFDPVRKVNWILENF